jgi:hypothetical protein
MNYNKKTVAVTELALLLTLFSAALLAAPAAMPAAEAATVKSVTGSGTGSFTCPVTTVNPNPLPKSSSLSFIAKGPFSVAGGAALTGTLTTVTGTLPQYLASGVVQINLCPGASAGSVSIAGNCGVGVPITLTLGTRSFTYTGNALCR